jgi:hypothetical protein
MFFSYFQSYFIQDRGVLGQLLMIFKTFVIFFYIESCNSSFSRNIAILGCFDVIQEEIMQIGKAKYLKTCEDFGKTMNEDSRGLERHYKRRNYVPKSQDILY